MQLLELVYRPEHAYVFHVDVRQEEVRKELQEQIKSRCN